MSLDDDLAEYQRQVSDSRSGNDIRVNYDEFRKTIKARYGQLSSDDVIWILRFLSNAGAGTDSKAFVAALLAGAQFLPQSLFEPLIRAAIYDINPSTNRWFVEPAVREFGFNKVAERFLEYMNDGTDFEKGGAVNALYWARVAARDDQKANAGLLQRIRDKYLTEFVSNVNVQVRRCIIPSLDMDASAYSADLRNLLTTAVQIARNHADDYIRHRIEVQMGNERLLKPLPDRET